MHNGFERISDGMELSRQISNPSVNVRITKVLSEVSENFCKDGQNTVFPPKLILSSD